MKRRWMAVLLAAVLLLGLMPPGASAASDICFVSINDTMPDNIPFAYVKGGVAYIPCSALSGFRIYNLYDANIATVLVYTSSQQITIDMNRGIATDKDGTEYNATAIYRNGQVYVPAHFICPMFSLSASYIEGVGYGDICRITDGTQVMGDDLFLSAATNLMRSRYNAYLESITPTPEPSVSPNVVEEPPTVNGETQVKPRVYLAFLGLPTGHLLNLLKNEFFTAAFFLTAEDIATAPDTVRRIVGEGHSVGIYCPEGTLQEVETARELLFEAAHTTTVLVTAGETESTAFLDECRETGYVPCRFDINGINGGAGVNATGAVTGRLNQAREDVVLMLQLTNSNDSIIRAIVYHLYANHYTSGVLREVGYTGGNHRVK